MALTQKQQDWLDAGRFVVPKIMVMDGDEVIAEVDGQYDILSNTMTFERNASAGSGYKAGYVEAAELSFTILNTYGKYDDIVFEGKELLVYLDIGASVEDELAPYGRYIVDTKPIIGRTIEIKALDYIARLSQPCTIDISGMTVAEALGDVLSSCSITLYPGSFTNGDKVLGTYDDLDDATAHEMVQWLVALTGGVGYMTVEASPRFRIAELDAQATATVIPRTQVMKESHMGGENEYSGVGFQVDDIYYQTGDDTLSFMELETNPLLTEDAAFNSILLGLGTSIIGVKVASAYSINTLSKPYIMPLEKVTYHDEFDNPITTYILTNKWNVNQGSQMSADWSLEPTTGYASMSPLTPAQRVAIRKVARRTAQELANATTTYDEALINLNERMANALGYYVTEVEQAGGGKVVYTHDQPTLEASSYISYQSAAGFAFTNTGWNDGDPTWTSGILSEGTLIMRLISAVGINAEWINLQSTTTLNDAINYLGDISGETSLTNTIDTKIAANGITLSESIMLDVSDEIDIAASDIMQDVNETITSELGTISAQINQLKSGGGNLIVNSNMGDADNPSFDYWNATDGLTWEEAEGRGLTWQTVESANKTWVDAMMGIF